jgi:hypothetical protein
MVLPKPAVAPNQCKSKILPPLAAPDGEASLNPENSERVNAPEVKPRSNLREKIALLAIESKPKRHSVEPLAPIPCDGVEPQNTEGAHDEASITLPPPMLTQARRNVKKPTAGQL